MKAPVGYGGTGFKALSGTQLVGMNQTLPLRETGQCAADLPAFIPDWEPYEGDVLWSRTLRSNQEAYDAFLARDWDPLFLTEEDAFSAPLIHPGDIEVEYAKSGNIEVAKQNAKKRGRTYIALWDGQGNEIHRWPL